MSESVHRKVVVPPPRFATTRLTEAEFWAYVRFASRLNVKPARFLRKAIRDGMGQGPDPLKTEYAALLEAAAQMGAVGRNLNQLVRKVNAGEVVAGNEFEPLLHRVSATASRIESSLHEVLKHARDRRIHNA